MVIEEEEEHGKNKGPSLSESRASSRFSIQPCNLKIKQSEQETILEEEQEDDDGILNIELKDKL